MRLAPRTLDDSKLGKVDAPILRRAWAARHPHCQFCGDTVRLHTHHIAGAAGRSDEPCNWLRVCQLCHDAIHANRIQLATVLACKLLSDPEEFDLCRVLRLKGTVFSVDIFLSVANEVSRRLANTQDCTGESATSKAV